MTVGRVVVTGASTGIGADTVRVFRRRGWEVVGVARRSERLQALAAETGASAFTADLTVQDDVDRLRGYLAGSGGVSALVNNAGGARGLDSVEAGSIEDWRWMFEVNVLAAKRVTTALLPLLREAAARAGHADILTITSTAAFEPYAGGGGYNAAKFAEHAMTEVLRLELNGEPIRVTEVAPGLVHTEEFSLNRFGGDAERAAKVYADVPAPLTGRDVAETIADAVERPGHVAQDLIVIRPVAQASATRLHRGPLTVAQ